MEHEFKVFKLHDVPYLLEEAAQLINSEWPRSLEARYTLHLQKCRAIKSSSDDLPCSFLLLKVWKDGVQKVVGFSHLSKVLQKPKSVLIESVIVDKTLRGCGLGKMMMRYTEEFALKQGYEFMHLSTNDKQSFYEHLGYSLSIPVSRETEVARFVSKSQIQETHTPVQHERMNTRKSAKDLQTGEIEQTGKCSPCSKSQTAPAISIPAAPPVPSIPSTGRSQKTPQKAIGGKVFIWMKKRLYGQGTPL